MSDHKLRTREEWLVSATCEMVPLFNKSGYKLPPIRVSCGWPHKGATSAKSRRIGECWSVEASSDGVTEIFISPYLSDAVGPHGVLSTLVHEVVHAVVGVAEAHNKTFSKCARAVGLTGKLTSTEAGPELLALFSEWVKQLGDYPHATLDLTKSPTKKQSTRMVKCECADCGYVIRTAKKWLDLSGPPLCACNKRAMLVDGTSITEEDPSDE